MYDETQYQNLLKSLKFALSQLETSEMSDDYYAPIRDRARVKIACEELLKHVSGGDNNDV